MNALFVYQIMTMKKPYSNVNKGWRDIGDHRCYLKSGWEMNWARYLQFLKERKLILEWEYEPETFWFEKIKRGVRSYTPDFRVIFPDGSVVFQEVKGYMDDKSRTKLKRMGIYYPGIKMDIIDKNRYNIVKKTTSFLIKDWDG